MERRCMGTSDASACLDMAERWTYRESRRHGIPRYYFGGKLKCKADDLERRVRQQRAA